MSTASKDNAPQTVELPVAIDRRALLDEYTVNFVTIRETHDLGPMLKGLPGDSCQCPHWGYVLSGQIRVRYGDAEEVIRAGEAFYMPPGHVPAADAGTELIQFSPTADLAATEAAIAHNLARS